MLNPLWSSGCHGPRWGMHVGVHINGHLGCALVRGPPLKAIWYCIIHCTATSGWIAGNWSYIQPREAIPQPQLQPNLSKEIRRRRQFAHPSRAACKPFAHPNHGKKRKRKKRKKEKERKSETFCRAAAGQRVSPIVFVSNCMTVAHRTGGPHPKCTESVTLAPLRPFWSLCFPKRKRKQCSGDFPSSAQTGQQQCPSTSRCQCRPFAQPANKVPRKRKKKSI